MRLALEISLNVQHSVENHFFPHCENRGLFFVKMTDAMKLATTKQILFCSRFAASVLLVSRHPSISTLLYTPSHTDRPPFFRNC